LWNRTKDATAAWDPAPSATHRGKPLIGFRGRLLVRGATGSWKTFARTPLALLPQDIIPHYEYYPRPVRLPKWVRHAKVACSVPRGIRTYARPVPLYLTPPAS
jgi:hypothetical protein